jgi:hypothetical protein
VIQPLRVHIPGLLRQLSRLPSDRRVLLGLAAAVVVEIAFLLAIPRYVTVDGAQHVGGAAMLRDIVEGNAQVHFRYIELASFPPPNVLPELGLALAMLVLDPVAAEKLLQIVYVVAIPLSLLFAARWVRPGSNWLAVLAVSMTFTFAFQFGFYDFSFAVAFFLLAGAYAWRHREDPTWLEAATFGGLALLVYLSHIVAYAELGVLMATASAWRLFLAWRAGGVQGGVVVVRRAIPFFVGALPSLVLAIEFFVRTHSAAPADFLPIGLQAIGVLGLALGLATAEPLEIVASVGLAVTLLGLVIAAIVIRARSGPVLRDHDAFFVYAAVAAAIAILSPASVESGGSYIPQRLALFPVYGVALWLAAVNLPRWTTRTADVGWIVIAAVFLVARLPVTMALSADAIEYEALAPCVALGATMIQVNLSLVPRGSLALTDPFTSETGRIAAATQGHDLGNFEGAFPFFLIENHAVNNPYVWLLTRGDGFYLPPPGVDLDRYRTRPEGVVDYVFVVGRPRATLQTLAASDWTNLDRELESGYRRVEVSSSGLVEEWERNDPTLDAAGERRREVAPACAQGTGGDTHVALARPVSGSRPMGYARGHSFASPSSIASQLGGVQPVLARNAELSSERSMAGSSTGVRSTSHSRRRASSRRSVYLSIGAAETCHNPKRPSSGRTTSRISSVSAVVVSPLKTAFRKPFSGSSRWAANHPTRLVGSPICQPIIDVRMVIA